MNKKNIIIGLVTATLLLTGCGNASNNANNSKEIIINTSNNSAASSEVNDSNEPVTDNENADLIGEVLSISDNMITLLQGDLIVATKIANEDIKHIYVGQIVTITKETETDYSVIPYYIEDFSIRHTTMGDLIERVTGNINQIDNNSITITQADGETLTATVGSDSLLTSLVEGLNSTDSLTYEFDVVQMDDFFYVLSAYNTNSKLALTITELNKTADHTLEILASDQNGSQFYIDTKNPIKNFNLSDLVVGQEIEVYANVIMESEPAQVDASRIDLKGDLPTGVTSIDYDVVGDVIQIEDGEVHVLSGDIAEIFNVDNAQLENIHLGEKVKLYSKNGKLIIEPYLQQDFSQRYTNMGHIIESYSGKVNKIQATEDGHLITLINDDILTDAFYYGDILPVVNTYYEFDFVSFLEDEKNIINYYDPESIISMTVTSLERSENGELVFSATDTNDGDYRVGTSSITINFNISELKVGDVLNVYADAVMESWPMQVETTKIIKVNRQ